MRARRRQLGTAAAMLLTGLVLAGCTSSRKAAYASVVESEALPSMDEFEVLRFSAAFPEGPDGAMLATFGSDD